MTRWDAQVLHAGAAGCSELFEQVLTRLASRKELREDMSSEAIQLPRVS